jgi:hypothetical protein
MLNFMGSGSIIRGTSGQVTELGPLSVEFIKGLILYG